MTARNQIRGVRSLAGSPYEDVPFRFSFRNAVLCGNCMPGRLHPGQQPKRAIEPCSGVSWAGIFFCHSLTPNRETPSWPYGRRNMAGPHSCGAGGRARGELPIHRPTKDVKRDGSAVKSRAIRFYFLSHLYGVTRSTPTFLFRGLLFVLCSFFPFGFVPLSLKRCQSSARKSGRAK